MFPRRRAVQRAQVLVAAALVAGDAGAQTDYYNLDAGRPLRVEDALVIERHALEWQVAPLRFSGARGRRQALGLEPELAWGVFPRTQVEVGVPLLVPRGGPTGAGGVEVTALHALNAETQGWPGLAVRGGVHLPAGPHGPSAARGEFAALATRTMTSGRVHANAMLATGPRSDGPRWSAGVAVDRTFALRSMLVGMEVMVEDAPTSRWSTAMGMRYQVGPRSAVDLGIGRTFGDAREWFLTMGSAVSFGLLHRFGWGQ